MVGKLGVDTLEVYIKKQDQQKYESAHLTESLRAVELSFYKIDSCLFFPTELDSIPSLSLEYDTSSDSHPLAALYNLFIFFKDPQRLSSAMEYFSDESETAYDTRSLIRILNYGDSQLSNNGISNSFRLCMQRAFGGSGEGLVGLNRENNNATRLIIGKEWKTIRMWEQKRQGNYGILGCYLTPPPTWAINPSLRKKKFGEIEIELKGSNKGKTIEVLVHENTLESDIKLLSNNTIVEPIDGVRKGFGLKRYTWGIPQESSRLKLQVLMDPNRSVYAISLNDTIGVSVDNLPYTHSNSNVFMPQHRAFLGENYNLLNAKLIFYNFGIDAVPLFVKIQSDSSLRKYYSEYSIRLLREIAYLHTIAPNVPVCIVGIPPIKVQHNGKLIISPDAYIIREIQRDVALRSSCIFIDIWQFALSNHSLFAPDYRHFSTSGAELMGKVLYKSLITDYSDFVEKQRKTL